MAEEALLVLATMFAVFLTVVLANAILNVVAGWKNPPLGAFLEIEGVRLHYVDQGRRGAPVLVMLHGNGVFLQDMVFSGLLDAATLKFRVICFDRPGFGHSSRSRRFSWNANLQAAIISRALTRLNVDNVIVLGHSWGTLVALAMAARKDSLVKGLVLVSGYYFPTWRFDGMIAGVAALPIVGDLLRYTISPLSTWLALPALAKKAFSPKPVPAIVKERYPRTLLICPRQLRAVAEDGALMVSSAKALSTSYSQITCPTSIFVGLGDAIVDSEQAIRLQKVMPRAELKRFPDLGHMLHYFAVRQIVEVASSLPTESKAA
jgi:pimeloyl-ACP methyl ester carboxylesterase